ncbi:MAG: histidine phosphatase family protein [Saprospiraceae bacterium]
MFFLRITFMAHEENFQLIAKSFDEKLIKHIEEPRIREQEWGHLKGEEESRKIDAERDQYGVFYYRIPDGESAADVYDRVSDFFGTLHRDFKKKHFPENCVIVTHGMTIRLFLMKWFHWTVEEFEQLKNPINCSMFILEQNEQGKYKLITEPEKKSE